MIRWPPCQTFELIVTVTLHPVQVLLIATLPAALMVKIHPFLGMGVGLLQEIDLKRDGIEKSFNSDGDVALQFNAGADYLYNQKWSLATVSHYSSLSSINLDGERNCGQISEFNYKSATS